MYESRVSVYSDGSMSIQVDHHGHALLFFRCGMVYVDPGQLGWKPYVTSWLQRVGGKLKEDAQVPCTSYQSPLA